MIQSFEIKGFFGYNNPTTILVVELTDGSSWYCIQGSEVAFQTWDIIEEGVHVAQLADFDTICHEVPIFSLDDLVEAVDEYSQVSVLSF